MKNIQNKISAAITSFSFNNNISMPGITMAVGATATIMLSLKALFG